jgi:hypothetical protein
MTTNCPIESSVLENQGDHDYDFMIIVEELVSAALSQTHIGVQPKG